MRVIAENFAAKLPPSPPLTVPEYQSSKAHGLRISIFKSSRSKNINIQANDQRQNKLTHIQNTVVGRKASIFPTQIFNSTL
jgi:hypothetical protein